MAVRERNKKFSEWSKAVKDRDGWRCQVTGAYYGQGSGVPSRGLEAAHIFSRHNPYVRFDVDNGVSLSYRMHRYWAHRRPAEFMEWVRGWMGEERFEDLRHRAFQGERQTALGLDNVQRDMLRSTEDPKEERSSTAS